jgi:hypothetical protein
VSVRPNFFIVGAPKCGTTSLYECLRGHPEVFMPPVKEPHYFSTDIYRPLRMDEAAYFALFAPGASRDRIGEASAEYLYSAGACASINALDPTARIIIMLRNPVDMIFSAHAERVWNGREDLDFEDALAAEDDRKRGLRLPPHAYPLEFLFYREMGQYSKHVERYLETFGRAQVHVPIFEDLEAHPTACFRAACTFLDVDPSFVPDFAVRNPYKQPRLRSLARILQAMTPARRVVRPLAPHAVRTAMRWGVRLLYTMNTKFPPRPPMRPSLRRELQEWFLPDVEKLSQLLGRDLTYWCRSDEREIPLESLGSRRG